MIKIILKLINFLKTSDIDKSENELFFKLKFVDEKLNGGGEKYTPKSNSLRKVCEKNLNFFKSFKKIRFECNS
mgnify:CR=1 FL=1